jgi:hypothetical protein
MVPAQATPQASPTLTGAAAMNALIGNTVQFQESDGGAGEIVYFLPDGTLRRRSGRSSTWHLSGDRICVPPKGEWPGPAQCLSLHVTGDTVILVDSRTAVARGRIRKGNPENL